MDLKDGQCGLVDTFGKIGESIGALPELFTQWCFSSRKGGKGPAPAPKAPKKGGGGFFDFGL